jgi:hypothetical protein
MKKFTLCLLCIAFLCLGSITTVRLNYFSPVVYAQRDIPLYAKWGNIAVHKTQEKYPDAKVVDYLHVGRERKTKTSVETFKLWLKGKDREFGVYVTIEFTNESEQIIAIAFKEVAR